MDPDWAANNDSAWRSVASAEALDERQRLAAVGQQPRRRVFGLALAGIRLAVEVRVTFENHAAVGIVAREPNTSHQ